MAGDEGSSINIQSERNIITLIIIISIPSEPTIPKFVKRQPMENCEIIDKQVDNCMFDYECIAGNNKAQ